MACTSLLVSVALISASLRGSAYPPEFATAPDRNSCSPVGSYSGENDQSPPQLARSQSHGIFATLQLAAARAVTWANGLGARFSLIPIRAALDCSCAISASIQANPVAYGRLKLRAVPAVIPAPQYPGAVPGFTQVVVPFGTTFQPLLASRSLALPGLYGYGSPALPLPDSQLVTGAAPTGPTVTFPYPRSGPASTAPWFIMYASACRKYSCLMIAAWSPIEDWKFIAV